MKTPTEKENEALLLILRDFTRDYNANSISKQLKMTPRGALKALRNLEAEGLVIGKRMGHAVFYRINFEDKYTMKLLEALLIKESQEKAGRWLSEFGELSRHSELLIVFGSAARGQKKASDIDVLAAIPREKFDSTSRFFEKKRETSLKPIHPVIMTMQDLENNLKKGNGAMIAAVREGYVLYGQDMFIGVVRDVRAR